MNLFNLTGLTNLSQEMSFFCIFLYIGTALSGNKFNSVG